MRARLAFAVVALFTWDAARAMPNFARREGVDCTLCHTTIPRLNRFGYEYRNAGYRQPTSIGDPKQKDLPDLTTMIVGRLQTQPEFIRTRTAGTTTNHTWLIVGGALLGVALARG